MEREKKKKKKHSFFPLFFLSSFAYTEPWRWIQADGFSSSEAKVKANPPRREAPPTKPNAHVATALPSAPPPVKQLLRILFPIRRLTLHASHLVLDGRSQKKKRTACSTPSDSLLPGGGSMRTTRKHRTVSASSHILPSHRRS